MSRTAWAFAVVLAGLVTFVGCRPSASPVASVDTHQTATLEARIARLEKDFRTVAVARDAAVAERDAATKRAADFEKRWALEAARAGDLERSHDAMTATLLARTTQLDKTAAQLDHLKSGLKGLLASLDGPAPPPSAGDPLTQLRSAK